MADKLEKETQTHWGAYIAGLRRQSGYTQKQLADIAGMGVSTISKWELRETRPENRLDIQSIVARLLGAPNGSLKIPIYPKKGAPTDQEREINEILETKLGSLQAIQEYPIKLSFLLGTAWKRLDQIYKDEIISFLEYQVLRAGGRIPNIYLTETEDNELG